MTIQKATRMTIEVRFDDEKGVIVKFKMEGRATPEQGFAQVMDVTLSANENEPGTEVVGSVRGNEIYVKSVGFCEDVAAIMGTMGDIMRKTILENEDVQTG